eukprot:TRINITY_DN16762_c0_g1_i1.p1 TRINITY_DN16762_c0_g1~~TRINITY_DN16762_c0_g1_i1.p1  ORF type:complete len:279 (+),score=56.94 TRINITY_DN16762_c0_g1_i1:609-1445(+)
MSNLNQKREQFARRQAELQARNVNDAASAAAAVPPPQTATAAAPFKAVSYDPANWQKDKEHYKQCLYWKAQAVGLRMKKVIDILLQTRRPMTPEEILALTYVDIDDSEELRENLAKNMKVTFTGTHYMYKAKHELNGKPELLHLIRQNKDGIALSEVKDSYANVPADVQELRSAGHVWGIQNSDTLDDILYPNDPKIQMTVDEDIKSLVRGIKLPSFEEIEKELKRAGMTPSTSAARRESMLAATVQQKDKPKKRKRESTRTKFTNSHMLELFTNNGN